MDMPTTDEQGRVMSLSEALRMAKEQGQIKGKETGGLKHSEGMSEADFVAMYQKQQQDNLRAELLVLLFVPKSFDYQLMYQQRFRYIFVDLYRWLDLLFHY